MNLDYHSGAHSLGVHTLLYAYHRYLDDVRRGALDGHIDRHALAGGAHVVVARLDFVDVASAAA